MRPAPHTGRRTAANSFNGCSSFHPNSFPVHLVLPTSFRVFHGFRGSPFLPLGCAESQSGRVPLIEFRLSSRGSLLYHLRQQSSLKMYSSVRSARRILTLSLTVLLSACVAPDSSLQDSELPPFPGKVSGDYKQIQGSWVVTSNEIRKKSLPQMSGVVFHFSGNQHWIGGDKGREWFALNGSSLPKAIDFYDKKSPTIRGIYKIEGDRLTLCTAAPGQPRPTEFSTSPFTGTILTTTRRQ